MGLFKEVNCAHCGKKAGTLTRQKLASGEYVCKDCWGGMPSSMLQCLNEYDYDDFVRLLAYIDYSKNELSKIFKENHSYYSIHIDTEHKLFYLNGDHPRIYYKFEEISEFDIQFTADEVKEGLLGAKVNGKLYYSLKLEFPKVFKDEVLARDVKAKARVKDGLFKSKVLYDNPNGMDEFLIYFKNAWRNALDDKLARLYQEEREMERELHEEVAAFSELQAAMTLFMFEDLSDVTIEKLDKQRKRLLKTFHPDEGSSADTGFAQKINAAYDVIKKELV